MGVFAGPGFDIHQGRVGRFNRVDGVDGERGFIQGRRDRRSEQCSGGDQSNGAAGMGELHARISFIVIKSMTNQKCYNSVYMALRPNLVHNFLNLKCLSSLYQRL